MTYAVDGFSRRSMGACSFLIAAYQTIDVICELQYEDYIIDGSSCYADVSFACSSSTSDITLSSRSQQTPVYNYYEQFILGVRLLVSVNLGGWGFLKRWSVGLQTIALKLPGSIATTLIYVGLMHVRRRLLCCPMCVPLYNNYVIMFVVNVLGDVGS